MDIGQRREGLEEILPKRCLQSVLRYAILTNMDIDFNQVEKVIRREVSGRNCGKSYAMLLSALSFSISDISKICIFGTNHHILDILMDQFMYLCSELNLEYKRIGKLLYMINDVTYEFHINQRIIDGYGEYISFRDNAEPDSEQIFIPPVHVDSGSSLGIWDTDRLIQQINDFRKVISEPPKPIEIITRWDLMDLD